MCPTDAYPSGGFGPRTRGGLSSGAIIYVKKQPPESDSPERQAGVSPVVLELEGIIARWDRDGGLTYRELAEVMEGVVRDWIRPALEITEETLIPAVADGLLEAFSGPWGSSLPMERPQAEAVSRYVVRAALRALGDAAEEARAEKRGRPEGRPQRETLTLFRHT